MPEEAKKTTKEVANEVAGTRTAAREQAAKNAITSRFGKTKTFKIDEGTDHEQTFILQFPGTVEASNLLDSAQNPFGNLARTFFMEQAIKKIIVAPKIKDLKFFDEHHGYSEVYDQVVSFLTDGLN